MPKKIDLTLPEPPSVNRIWRTGRGRVYKVKKAAQYEETVVAVCRKAGIGAVPFPAGPVKYTLTWHRTRKNGDLSNRLKLLEDSLNGIVWGDDEQVVEFHCYRTQARRGQGRIELRVEAV